MNHQVNVIVFRVSESSKSQKINLKSCNFVFSQASHFPCRYAPPFVYFVSLRSAPLIIDDHKAPKHNDAN